MLYHRTQRFQGCDILFDFGTHVHNECSCQVAQRVFRGNFRRNAHLGSEKKPQEVKWLAYWIANNHSMEVYMNFWIHHHSFLDSTQKIEDKHSEERIAFALNAALEKVENLYAEGDLIILVNNSMESAFISALLTKHGFLPLDKSRSCVVRPLCDLPSFAFGLSNQQYFDHFSIPNRCIKRKSSSTYDARCLLDSYTALVFTYRR